MHAVTVRQYGGTPAVKKRPKPGKVGPGTYRNDPVLGRQLANLNVDVPVGTTFVRTQRTIRLALGARQIPRLIDRDFDEIRVGDLDGEAIQDY